MKIDPRFGVRMRANLGSTMFEDWTADAACRADHLATHTSLHQKAGHVYSLAFADEVAYRVVGAYRWPAAVWEAMQTCATCPVRAECLAHAYASEDADLAGEPAGTTGRRYGVWGGLPGRQRERFAGRPDRLEASASWFDDQARQRRWVQPSRGRKATA